MFNLKKAQAQFVSNFTPKVTVKMIHDEFDTAVDLLLSEVLNEDPDKIKAHESLRNAGFRSAKPVRDASELIRKIYVKNETRKNAAYYKEHYPFNKFIIRDSVAAICEKYGLVFGASDNYIGDIPTKNIKEISEFKLRDEDRNKIMCGWYEPTQNNNNTYWHPCIAKSDTARWGHTHHGSSWFSPQSEESAYVFNDLKMEICAPLKEFDMKNSKLAADGISIIPEDPIVLQPVSGGYLIVSKWGDEAEDKDLVNETMN